MTVVTRFAPSPTGFLHIGGARTALFNWLFARHHGGKYLLRIEDTDRARSTQEAIDAIIEGLDWLGLEADGDIVFQSERQPRHADVAWQLLADGKAYHCYCTSQELTAMREKARAEKRTILYDRRWRDRDPADAPEGIPPVVRFKAPRDGVTIIDDAVQGEVTVANDQLDDMVLLRADGTPTYMLSVVVDDHDMGISHVIRGDDHLTNAFRQTQLFKSIGWTPPIFGHIPLIHGADGAKLSKRHGALGVDAYREMGYLPEALLNYLMRLGWSHGDDEIIPIDKAVEWFDIHDVNRAAARMDFDKLAALNGHYMRGCDDARLVALITPELEEKLDGPLGDAARARVMAGMKGLKSRAKTIKELVEISLFYTLSRPLVLNEKAARMMGEDNRNRLARLRDCLAALDGWTEERIEEAIKDFAAAENEKLGKIAQPLRAALCGATVSPGIFEVAAVLGAAETLGRLDDAVSA